jgi:hypothetical protein
MQEQILTEWLNHPGTMALVRYLRRRKAPVVDSFLAGEAIPPHRQGKASGFHEIEVLLSKRADEVRTIFEGSKQEKTTCPT